jgi:gliding motility-associated peptidyl-prolyl isomerase
VLGACEKLEPRKAVNLTKVSELEKTIAINKRLFSEEQRLMKKYMELDSSLVYMNSGKGFWYAHLRRVNNSVFPKKGDEVLFEQEIIDLSGTILYAKKDLGLRKYVIDKEHIIKGLKEGLKLMKEGEEVKFLFSSFVAYRMNGDTSHIIESNEPVISTVKLIKVN